MLHHYRLTDYIENQVTMHYFDDLMMTTEKVEDLGKVCSGYESLMLSSI